MKRVYQGFFKIIRKSSSIKTAVGYITDDGSQDSNVFFYQGRSIGSSSHDFAGPEDTVSSTSLRRTGEKLFSLQFV